MNKCYYSIALPLVMATLGLALSASWTTTAQDSIVYLNCDGSPVENTNELQRKIDAATPGTTLMLPPGVCVLAHCRVVNGGKPCFRKVAGVGSGQYFSAVDIDRKSNLTLAGAPKSLSVLKLDPNPPPRSDGYHNYCGVAHVLSIRRSSYITLRDFTVDGSDGKTADGSDGGLPEGRNQCPINNPAIDKGKISEHMYDVLLENSADVTLNRMKLTRAHGDGLNLIADRTPTNTDILFTERVSVTDTDFLDNDRSGIAFQRNVRYVTIRGNYFKNSGDDQDLDMEPTGGSNEDNLGPQEVDIDNNLFERVKPGLTVTLGVNNTQWSNGVRFTNNTIRSAQGRGEGGCILVYGANNTTIANNRISGAKNCVTLTARRITDLRVENNFFDGYTNLASAGNFLPSAVINISEDHEKQDAPDTCGGASQPPCHYFIYYPERITITGNAIAQHVQNSQGIKLSDVDGLVLANNIISHTNAIEPAGAPPDDHRPTSVNLFFGLHVDGEFLNERTRVSGWSITGNNMIQFAYGIRIRQLQSHVTAVRAEVNGNLFNTAQSSPQGILLDGATQSGFIDYLTVDSNFFGCGFPGGLTLQASPPPPNAFVRPSGQEHTGNIGYRVACQPQ